MVLLFVSGYLFSRPGLPQCGMVVQRRLRSSNSLPYWISCSLHRPLGALIVAVSPAKRKRRAELDSGNSNRCI